MFLKLKIVILFSLTSFIILAQANNEAGLLPTLQFNTKLSEKISLSNIAETRYVFFDNKSDDKKQFEYKLTDFTMFLGVKTSKNNSFLLGYTLRLKPFDQSHRFLQQYKVVNKLAAFNLEHSFGLDQTFNKHEFAIFRARYRINFIKPLQGKTLENKEFYFKQGLEFIGLLQYKSGDLEIRITPKLGYQLNDKSTFELGLDYRLNKFISNNLNNKFLCNIAWFVKINPKDKKE